jgi:hypothetical protein
MDRHPERAPTIALTAATNSPAFRIGILFSSALARAGVVEDPKDHWAIYRFGEMGDRAIALSDATHQEELL